MPVFYHMHRTPLTKSFAGVQGAVFQKSPLVAEGIGVSGWAYLNFLSSFSFYAHPVDKNRGIVDPHGGHQFF
jgi:hypothetical protein